jgi:hypothetical protein
MTTNLEDTLQHYGVKGMRWGVIRNRNRPGGADGVVESDKGPDGKKKSRLRRNLDSLKRERDWKKAVSEIDKMSTKDINAMSKRIGLENDLKIYSKTKGVGTKKDRDDYLRRDKMSDQELSRKVVRLKAKNKLNNNINSASKEQREIGEKIFNIGSDIAISYAKQKTLGDFNKLYDKVDKGWKDQEPGKTKKKIKSDLQKELFNKLVKKPNSNNP